MPALQAVDGAPSRTMTVHGRRLLAVDLVISRRTLNGFEAGAGAGGAA
jgi:hypothetical protein